MSPGKHPDAAEATKLENTLTAAQLAKITKFCLQNPLEPLQVSSSEQSASSEETSSSDSSETSGSSGNSGSELESSSGSEPTTSDDSTTSDSDEDVTGEEEVQPVIPPVAEHVKPSTVVESLAPKPELLPSQKKSSNPVPSDATTSSPHPQPKPSQKEICNPIAAYTPEDPDSTKASDKNALVKGPAENRSVTMVSDLPPELAGGWGDEPTPAPWDWQGMPFDYMGILEEQRRTVYYELHERDGQDEWVLKNYKKDGKSGDYGRVRGRGESRGNSYRRGYNRSEDQSEGKSNTWVPRGRGRGRGSPRSNYKNIDFVPQQEQYQSDVVEVQTASIIDTPIDFYDTAGLISADPQRPSLPIAETKEEAKKSSAAWTKEGKRDREMSYLILPRPEKVTMPAAILPKPDKKHCKKKSWEASLSDKPSEHVKIDGSAPAPDSSAPVIPGPVTLAPVIEKASPVVQSQAPSGLNAGQLLLQLVTMLRRDDSTLASLKTIVDGMSRPTEPSPTASMQELKAEAVSSPPLAQEPAPAIQFAEVEPAQSDKEEKLETPAAIKLQIPSPVVEPILASPPDLAIHANPPAAVESVITPDEHQKVPDSTPAVDEIMIFPQKKSKSHKHKHDKSEKHKSKSKHSHKKSSAAPAEKPTIVVTASDDEDLVKEELWYHVDDPTDGGDESEIPPGESKGKTAAVDVNQRPHVVGKLYEPPSLHATKKLSKSTSPAEPKVNGESDLSAKPVATETPVEKPASSPSAPFEFNPTPPRRVKRRVVLISNDASTQTPTPPRTPPTGPIPEMILHPSPERPTPETPTTAPKPAIAKPAAVQPAVIVSAPVRSVVKPTTVPASPPRPRVQHSGKKLGTPVTKEYAPLSVPDSYTGSDEVYMKTLMNVDAGDDLMIVSNLKEEEAVVMQVISAQSHVVQSHDVQSPIVESPAVQSDVAPETVVAPKEPLPDLVTPPTQDPSPKEIAAEALAAIKDDPAALYNLLAALTSQPPSEKPAKAKKEKKEKKRKDRDGEKHKKAKVVVEEELLGDLLGDEGSVASLPVLNPSP